MMLLILYKSILILFIILLVILIINLLRVFSRTIDEDSRDWIAWSVMANVVLLILTAFGVIR